MPGVGATLLPCADVIVNPNQPGCGFESKSMAGVGVMFYVLLALRSELRSRGVFDASNQPKLDTLLPLVALGTQPFGGQRAVQGAPVGDPGQRVQRGFDGGAVADCPRGLRCGEISSCIS